MWVHHQFYTEETTKSFYFKQVKKKAVHPYLYQVLTFLELCVFLTIVRKYFHFLMLLWYYLIVKRNSDGAYDTKVAYLTIIAVKSKKLATFPSTYCVPTVHKQGIILSGAERAFWFLGMKIERTNQSSASKLHFPYPVNLNCLRRTRCDRD